MGELSASSIPAGASVSLDGFPWTKKTLHDGVCLRTTTLTPHNGRLDSGTCTITIVKTGYKSDSGTENICSQTITFLHPTLTAIPTTTPATSITATATAMAAATTTAAEPAATAASTA